MAEQSAKNGSNATSNFASMLEARDWRVVNALLMW